MNDNNDRELFDAAIVGIGPVGQVLGLLLAKRGYRIVVVDRQRVPYPLPRAVHVNPDIIRVLDQVGITANLEDFAEPARVYEWQNADRETLLRFEFAPESEEAWAESYMFHQPSLEEAMKVAGEALPGLIEVHRGTEAVALRDLGDYIELDVRSAGDHSKAAPTGEVSTFAARVLIGCDGARSFVREALGIDREVLGEPSQWVVVDALGELDSPTDPDNLQVCDPVRPWTYVSGGPGRRRYEFMALPGEDLGELAKPESVQRLLADAGASLAPEAVERTAPYTFEAKFAREWRRGRILLAGDSAHQMPPFFGQGLVSGVRDVANLAWKLDLVLSGAADPALLDSYESERLAHVQHAIGMSVELGKIICELDPEKVAARDSHLLAVGPNPDDALPPPPPERLGPGVFPAGAPDVDTDEGTFAPQGWLRGSTGTEQLLDRIADGSFALIVDGAEVEAAWLAARHDSTPAGLKMRALRILPADSTPASPIDFADLDNRMLPWLRAHGRIAAIVRPDFVTYGGAASLDELEALVAGLAERLALRG